MVHTNIDTYQEDKRVHPGGTSCQPSILVDEVLMGKTKTNNMQRTTLIPRASKAHLDNAELASIALEQDCSSLCHLCGETEGELNLFSETCLQQLEILLQTGASVVKL